MELIHIVCHAKNMVIGRNNSMIWNIPQDMRHFKRETDGKCVIMGRKTFESIGVPLPNRLNIVLSRNGFEADGVKTAVSIADALEIAELEGQDKVYIIGGDEIYKQTKPLIQTIIATELDKPFEGDAFYPEIGENFRKVESEWYEDEGLTFEINKYERMAYG